MSAPQVLRFRPALEVLEERIALSRFPAVGGNEGPAARFGAVASQPVFRFPQEGLAGTGEAGTGLLGAGIPGTGIFGTGLTGAGIPGTGLQNTGLTGAGIPGTGEQVTGLFGTGIPGTGIAGTGLTGWGTPTAATSGALAGGIPGTGMAATGLLGAGIPGTGIAATGLTGFGMAATGISPGRHDLDALAVHGFFHARGFGFRHRWGSLDGDGRRMGIPSTGTPGATSTGSGQPAAGNGLDGFFAALAASGLPM